MDLSLALFKNEPLSGLALLMCVSVIYIIVSLSELFATFSSFPLIFKWKFKKFF